jgi:hypothetical protein
MVTMRPIAIAPVPQARRTPSRRRDNRNAILACGLVGILSIALLVAIIVESPEWFAPTPRANMGAELRTASVLLVPATGDVCRQRVIDNATWRIKDQGPVDCEQALAKLDNAQTNGRGSGSRVDIIREAFRKGP